MSVGIISSERLKFLSAKFFSGDAYCCIAFTPPDDERYGRHARIHYRWYKLRWGEGTCVCVYSSTREVLNTAHTNPAVKVNVVHAIQHGQLVCILLYPTCSVVVITSRAGGI